MLGEAVEDVEPGMFLMHRPLGEESILERVYGVHLSTLQSGAALAKQAAAVAAAQRARLLRGDGSDAESSEEDEVVATVGFRGVLPKRIPRCGLTRGCWLLMAHPPATGSHHPAWNAIPGTTQESTSSCRHVRSLASSWLQWPYLLSCAGCFRYSSAADFAKRLGKQQLDLRSMMSLGSTLLLLGKVRL